MAAPAHAALPDGTVVDFEHKEMKDVVQEILLRFPCSASVACAAFYDWRLRGIVSSDNFLELFRKRHPSSPLLGIFASSDRGRFPLFKNVTSDTILRGVICRADTGLAYLDKNKDWHLVDCHNGRLLLCSADSSFCIYEPLSQRRVDCGSRPYDDEGDYITSCLFGVGGISPACHMVSLQQCGQSTEALESFRVVCLQRRRRSKSEVRAVEYDSGKLEWRAHPWNKFPSLEFVGGAMHAAGHIFWICSWAFLLVLDTNNMKFSMEPYPRKFGLDFSIGELEDGKGCAVCLQGLNTPDFDADGSIQQRHLKVRLQVWTIEKKEKKREQETEEDEEEEERCIFDWKMKEEVFVSKIIDKDARVYRVTKVVNGLVVICHGYNQDHYVINLKSKTQVAKFNNRGRGMPYLYQLPWPPSVLAGATTMASIDKKHIAGDEVSKHCPSNNKDGPAITEERHIDGDEVSKQCRANKDGPATTEERYIAGDEESKQCPSNNKDGPTTRGKPTWRYYTRCKPGNGTTSQAVSVSDVAEASTGDQLTNKARKEGMGLATSRPIRKTKPLARFDNFQWAKRAFKESKQCPSNNKDCLATTEESQDGDIIQAVSRAKETTSQDIYQFNQLYMQKEINVTWGCEFTETENGEVLDEEILRNPSTKYCSATAGKCHCGLEVIMLACESDTEEPFVDKLASGRPKRKAKAPVWHADYVSRGKGHALGVSSAADTEEPFDDKLASGVEDKELALAPIRPKRKAKFGTLTM